MEDNLARNSGGETGIRTLDRVSPIHAFQACAFSHSAISPDHISRIAAFSLLDDRAVELADLAPTAVEIPARAAAGGKRILRRRLLVDFHSPSRRLVRVQVSVLQDRAALEDFLRSFAETGVFLDAEIVTGEVEREVGA